MTKLSIGQAWAESGDAIKREGRLMVPVALAFVVIPATLFELALPPTPADQMAEPGVRIMLYPLIILIALIGQMAIMRMAIGPSASVGGVIRRALGRAPSVVGAWLIFVIPATITLYPFLLPILANPTSPPPTAALLLLVASIVFLCVWVRLILMTASGTAEEIGPVGIVKRSWGLTRGNFWRLLAMAVLFGLVAWIAMSAVQWVTGSVVVVTLGRPEPWSVSALLIALLAAIAQTIVSVLFAVLLARIYVQLSGAEPIKGV
jgi:hypothetical protein